MKTTQASLRCLLACLLLPACKGATSSDTASSSYGVCDKASSWEPNEEPDDSCLLTLPVLVEGKITPASKDVDNYVFVANEGAIYTVELTNTSGSGGFDERLSLTAKAGDVSLVPETAAMAKSATTYRELRPTEAGPVLLTVVGAAPATYTLRVLSNENLEHDATTYEPNNTPSSAAPLTLGDVVENELTLPEDHADNYSFEAEKNVVYTVELTNTSGGGGFDERLVLTAVLSATTGDNPLLGETGITAKSPSTYRELRPLESGLIVLSIYGAAPATYALRALSSKGQKHDAQTFEPNNTPSTATPLELGQQIASELSMPRDHEDHFQLAVEKGKTYAITHTATAGVDHVGIAATLLTDNLSEGTALFNGGSDPNTRYYEFTAQASGVADIVLSAPSAVSYELVAYPSTADGLEHDAESAEPNNTPATATPLSLDVPVNAAIDTTDDYVDCFQIDVKAGASYSVTASNTIGDGQFNISGSVNGAQVFNSGSGDQRRERSFPFTPAVSGRLLIQLDRPNLPGSYQLVITKE